MSLKNKSLDLVRVLVFSTILQIVAVSFIGGGNRRTRRNPPICRKSDKLDHIMLYTSPRLRFGITTSEAIGTDCIGSCKSNYHTITAMTALRGIISYCLKWTKKIVIQLQELFLTQLLQKMQSKVL